MTAEMSSKVLLFDIETNGFYHQTNKVHCLSYKELGSEGPVTRIVQPTRQQLVQWGQLADTYGTISAHNALSFDIPVLTKLCKWKPKTRVVDTLVLSCLLDPEIHGGHSLDAWGMRLGEYKGDYAKRFKTERMEAGEPYQEGDEWLEYSEDMGWYCDQDVRVLDKLYLELRERCKDWDWRAAINLEHDVARLIAWQERNGWHFNSDAANKLLSDIDTELRTLDGELRELLEWKCVPRGAPSGICRFTAKGTETSRYLRWVEAVKAEAHPVHPVEGEFCAVDLKLPELGSRQQMIEQLMKHGWKPTEYTEKGNPKFTEDSITDHIGPIGKKLVRRFVCVTRRGQVTGWLNSLRDDGRITAGAMPNATPTARMRHRGVVNVPRVGTPFGAELRALFCVPDGKVQMGADASGLELRMLAHYMDDPAYTDAVVNGSSKDGTDVHTINCKLLGLDPKKIYEFGGKAGSGRDVAKTFIYALLYGAGDEKIGSIIDGDSDAGKRLRRKFLKGLPKLAILIERVGKAAERGYLKGIDGRKIYVRHKHAALNSLLQSAGSIMVKLAMQHWSQQLIKNGVPFKLVGTFHDEVQAECDPQSVDQVGQQFCDSMRIVGQQIGMRCELAGEYKVGQSWYDCH